jgi:membrane protein implicated in regulation of membrane protease activity
VEDDKQLLYRKSLNKLYRVCALFSLMWTAGFFIVVYTPASFIYGFIGNLGAMLWVNFAVFIIMFAWMKYKIVDKFKRDTNKSVNDSTPM